MPKQHNQKADMASQPSVPPQHTAPAPKPPTRASQEAARPSKREIAASRGVTIFLEGYDDCLIGTTIHVTAPSRAGMPIAVYDRGLMKRKLMETMTSDVAEATIISSLMAQWYGAATPVISYPISYDL